jgi:hypothetical protein
MRLIRGYLLLTFAVLLLSWCGSRLFGDAPDVASTPNEAEPPTKAVGATLKPAEKPENPAPAALPEHRVAEATQKKGKAWYALVVDERISKEDADLLLSEYGSKPGVETVALYPSAEEHAATGWELATLNLMHEEPVRIYNLPHASRERPGDKETEAYKLYQTALDELAWGASEDDEAEALRGVARSLGVKPAWVSTAHENVESYRQGLPAND